ncbi:MAG: lysophospholipid acyltransferase family protein [Solirubrobacteraceae bacterium]
MPQTMDRHAQRRALPVLVHGRRGGGMGRILGALSADARMLGAISADVAHAADPRHVARRPPAADPFELRDPEYIARTLPALRVMADVWFRADVRGLENIPSRGPVLLVGNHSGGTLIADTFIFSQAFYDHFGPERAFFQLAHDLVFKVPGIRAMLTPYGTVPASPENMRRALARGAAVLVYPGGDHETYRASWHSAEIDFAHRTGFVRLALKHGVRIVPVVSIGGQETALFLGQGERIARLLHLHRLLRIDVAPVQIAPPWGVTVLDLPGRLPLPAKISIEVLPPIDLLEQLGGADGDPNEGYELVTGRMQDALRELDEERTLPLIG